MDLGETMNSSEAGDAVRGAVERLPELVDAQPALVRRARAMRFTIVLASGRERFYLPIEGGRIGPVVHGSQILRAAALSFTAEPDAWLAHWRPVPAPDACDLFALVKDERLRIEGDMTLLMRHLQNLKDILAAPRALFAEAA